MAVFFGPIYSLHHWRNAPSSYRIKFRSPRTIRLPDTVGEWGGVGHLIDVVSDSLESTDVLVASPNARSFPVGERREGQALQVLYEIHSSEFSSGSFCRIKQDVHVCSPELCALLMSRKLDEVETVQLMYELCGSYSIRDGSGSFIQREPLTSIKRIRSYVEKMSSMRGAKTFLELTEYVLDGSASPMETACAMTLLLPRRLGGYALKQTPKLNARIEIPAHAKKVIPKTFLVADFAWLEDSLVAEYDSSAEHEELVRIDADNNRRVGLGFLGYEVVTITRGRMANPKEFDKVYLPIAHHLGLRTRKPASSVLRKREALLWKLRRPVAF